MFFITVTLYMTISGVESGQRYSFPWTISGWIAVAQALKFNGVITVS